MSWSSFQRLLPHLYGLVIAFLVLHRGWSSFAVILLGIAIAIAQFSSNKPSLKPSRLGFGSLAMIGLFGAYLISHFIDEVDLNNTTEIERKSALLIFPLFWYFSRLRWEDIRLQLYYWLVGSVLLAGMVMLGQSLIIVISERSIDALFYSRFTEPIGMSPIYFAFYVSVALFWPVEPGNLHFSASKLKFIKIALVVLLLLSASKLFTVLALGIYIAQWFNKNKDLKLNTNRMVIAVLIVLLAIPVSKRFYELAKSPLSIVTQESYSYDTPFNGLTLRLVQSRFGLQILQEESAFVLGVGPSRAQKLLNEKYSAYNMYTGNPEFGDKGYIGYNFHNQWMETWVSNGSLGLLLLITIGVLLIKRTIHFRELSSIVILGIGFMFTESMLDREQGIVLFSIIAPVIFSKKN